MDERAENQERPPVAPKRRRVPSMWRFAAGAAASFVAVFGVLALRVRADADPALASAAKASGNTSQTTTTTTQSDDDAATTTQSDDDATQSTDDDAGSAVSSTPSPSTSAS